MSGECKSYRLNEPMAWKEFKAMPDDIKITYINLLRQKFDPPNTHIAKMMGVSETCVRNELERLNLTIGKHKGGRTKWDKEGFWAWVNRVDNPTPTPDSVSVRSVEPELSDQEPVTMLKYPAIQTIEETETFVEDDLPFEHVPVEPDPIYPKWPELYYALCAEMDELRKRVDELLKVNEELQKRHTEDKEHIAWLSNRMCEIEPERDHLAAQMEVVRMIFGGGNRV